MANEFTEEMNNNLMNNELPAIDVNLITANANTHNNQINNMNINTRFQWRYAPVSDLFIVYTDNYFTDINNRFVDFCLLSIQVTRIILFIEAPSKYY